MQHARNFAAIVAATLLFGAVAGSRQARGEPRIAADAIGGTVKSTRGAEAGVWVIAETNDFQTRFAKIVVTDDSGRFLIPEIPAANYHLWVRGYGLDDSTKVDAKPGEHIDLAAVVAPDPAAAAKNYPAAYWYAMMKIPDEAQTAALPGGRNAYLMWIKNMGCIGCHQLGELSTRTIPASLGTFKSSQEAWRRRLQSGQAGSSMIGIVQGALGGLPIAYLADWTDRIAAGDVPAVPPARPSGVERNVVATVRDWSNGKAYLHDLSSTDRRNPTVNAYGPVYGTPELSTDDFPVLDPLHNRAITFKASVRDPDTPTSHDDPVLMPSPYWGEERIWDSRANAHNPMIDRGGRVWYTARIRAADNPPFCKKGSTHPSASAFPLEASTRQLAVYEPGSGKYTFVDTCYSTHHLQFSEDANDTLWTSGGREVIAWLDTKRFALTGDAAASQGWAPLVLDTNANGKLDAWLEPGQPPDPTRDRRLAVSLYAIMPSPADGSVWGSVAFRNPGSIVRFDPRTQLSEIYNVPAPGFGVRGADIDRSGVVWVSLASGHLGEFDRRKCKGPLNGPTATGDHCPEGWTFHRLPGPGFVNVPQMSVESSYYTWVDQHDTLGLGANVPIATGNLFDGVHALVGGQFVTLRIPYPLGFYAKGLDGRIDDASAGWKGRGIWVTSGDRTPWHKEGGKGSKPLIVHFQIRPSPLAD
ncbi:MAG TPA: carboxypeptidase-like regulatory domain-containing protein [Steroidobacteraceae bacterium]|nr:carboxypeptidase-like regulatory domain-containing protein [Steroidobacteraceae bacterium]